MPGENHLRFRGKFAVDITFKRENSELRTDLDVGDDGREPVAGSDRTAEPDFIHRRKQKRRVLVLAAERVARHERGAGNLSRRLHKDDPGHHRIVREVPFEEFVLLRRESVFADRAGFIGGNQIVDEEKRIAVRQKFDARLVVDVFELRTIHRSQTFLNTSIAL